MKRSWRAALAALAPLSLCLPAQAASFAPNALFVSDRVGGKVMQVAPDGQVAATFTASGAISGARDLAFGPNGHLYVARPDRIVEIDGTGAVVSSFGQGSGIGGISTMAFGPDGDLFVASSTQDLVYVFDPADGSVVRTIGAGSGLDDPRGLAFGPTGDLFVSSFTLDRIFEFTPGGDDIRTFGNGTGLTSPGRICFGPHGYLYVVSTATGRILGFDDSLVVQTLGSDASLSADVAIAVGPDSKLWACDGSNGGLYRFGPDFQLESSSILAGAQPSGLAFAPFRFNASLTAQLSILASPVTKPKETIVLSIFPGVPRVMIQLTSTGAAEQLATLGNSPALVFTGFEVNEGDGAKTRSVEGVEIVANAAQQGTAAIGLKVKGKVDANGRFAPSSASGTLHRAAGHFVYSATVKTLSTAN